MRRKLIIFAVVLAFMVVCSIARGQTLTGSEFRITSKSSWTPIASRYRFGINTATGMMICVKPNGTSCLAAGGGGSGTVVSVAAQVPSYMTLTGSPITTSGTFVIGFGTQFANYVFAGPPSGGNALPDFRALVAADLPGHVHAASDITSGVFATARVVTGSATINRCLHIDASGFISIAADDCNTAPAGTGITTLDTQTGATQTFTRINDTNVTLTLTPASNNHEFALGWTGTLAKARTLATTVYTDQANTHAAGMKNSFQADATNAGLIFAGVTADPSSLTNGDMWHRSDQSVLKGRFGGATKTFAFIDSAMTGSTSGNAATSTALDHNPANCGAGNYPLGIDATGAVEGCTAAVGAGTVTTFSAGTLSPLFTTSVATASTTPALSFTLSNAAAHTFLGNTTGSTAAPSYSAITAADVPTLNQNTTGQANTAVALASNPANCSAGQVPQGVDASGVVENCLVANVAGAATYLTSTADANLTNEVVITPGMGLERKVGEADANGGPYTLDFKPGDSTGTWMTDEFADGNITNGTIGSMGWMIGDINAAPTVSKQTGTITNMGVTRLTTTATITHGGSVYLGGDSSILGNLAGTAGWEMIWVFRTPDTTLERFRIGFASTSTVTEPANGMWLRLDTSTGFADTAYKFEVRSSGSSTVISSGTTANTNFHTLRIRSTTIGTILMKLDSGTEQSFSTNVPTASMNPIMIVVTDTTAARNADVDFYAFKIRGLSR